MAKKNADTDKHGKKIKLLVALEKCFCLSVQARMFSASVS